VVEKEGYKAKKDEQNTGFAKAVNYMKNARKQLKGGLVEVPRRGRGVSRLKSWVKRKRVTEKIKGIRKKRRRLWTYPVVLQTGSGYQLVREGVSR